MHFSFHRHAQYFETYSSYKNLLSSFFQNNSKNFVSFLKLKWPQQKKIYRCHLKISNLVFWKLRLLLVVQLIFQNIFYLYIYCFFVTKLFLCVCRCTFYSLSIQKSSSNLFIWFPAIFLSWLFLLCSKFLATWSIVESIEILRIFFLFKKPYSAVFNLFDFSLLENLLRRNKI